MVFGCVDHYKVTIYCSNCRPYTTHALWIECWPDRLAVRPTGMVQY